MSDHLLSIFGLAGTIIFGVMSLFLGFRSLSSKRITWARTTETISTSGAKEGLAISFQGRKLDGVHVSRIVIWSSGRAAIVRAEISKIDPLRLIFPDNSEILSATIVAETSGGVGAAVTAANDKPDQISISFDILNSNEGFAIRVLHCGEIDNIRLRGTIQDVQSISEVFVESAPVSLMGRRIRVGAGVAVFGFTLIIINLITLMTFGVNAQHIINGYVFSFFGLILAVSVSVLLAFTKWGVSLPKSLGRALFEEDTFRHFRN